MKSNVKTNLANKFAVGKAKLGCTVAAAMTAAPATVHASGMMGGSNADAVSVVEAAIGIVVNIFPLIGAFFLVAGIFKLIMAYRDNRPEDQAAAAKDIVIGAIFIVFKVFAWNPLSDIIFGPSTP